MDELFTSLLVIGAEFGVIVGIILLILVVLFFKRQKKEKKIATTFASDFKDFSTGRKNSLEKKVSDSFDMNDEGVASHIESILNKERSICSNVLNIFTGKKKELLLQLQDDLKELTDVYHALVVHHQEKEPEVVESQVNTEEYESQIKVLTEDNDRLKEDLKKALESIDYLQAQYTELFKKTEGQTGDD